MLSTYCIPNVGLTKVLTLLNSGLYMAVGMKNDVLNPGFEDAGTGGATFADWTDDLQDGAIADETTLVHSGSHAVKLTAGASAVTSIQQTLTVVPGETRALVFWTRADGTNPGYYAAWDWTHTVPIIPHTSTGIPGTTYTRLATTFVVPSGCTSVLLLAYSPYVNGGIAYFDDIVCSVVGATATTPAAADTTLEGEIARNQVSTYTVNGSSNIVFQAHFASGQVSGQTIKKVAVFDAAVDGNMLCQELATLAVAAGNGAIVSVTYPIVRV